ncbi:paraquat-inducible protein A [Burkholderia sp. Ac-20353]|uniref:paraquat-inducible protein A n=1 Tax=Burkholderia sp. Ac-20353 TaxID=2703894 RepID=UPI00197B4509|nr:paraquat-inducible protein A [Burkholderia sp. Ac-20353]MBN3790981.1 paraquat-inducible protein A [Burkholderia sp. Ac-20353]
MDTFPTLIACEHCDSVYRRCSLASHEVARCERCSAVLFRSSWLNIDRWLALAVAAGVVFTIANLSPIMRISLEGLHSETTLWQSAIALAHGVAAPIAIPAALAIVVVPFLQIASLIWILAFARAGHRAPAFGMLMRVVVALRPWSMIEVGLLGILTMNVGSPRLAMSCAQRSLRRSSSNLARAISRAFHVPRIRPC